MSGPSCSQAEPRWQEVIPAGRVGGRIPELPSYNRSWFWGLGWQLSLCASTPQSRCNRPSPPQNNLVIDTPRVRKQTRHFSTLKDDDLVEFSDLESEDEERPRSRRHDRHHPLHHSYGRTDCFRVEKHLLVYG